MAGNLVHAGDVVWVHGGDYEGLRQRSTRRQGAPVVVRGYPGERAKLIGCSGGTALTIRGDYTWFWGLEVTSCQAGRYSADNQQDFGVGVQILGHDTRLVNNFVHDTAQGVSHFSGPKRVEIYGNLITYNGYDLADRGHGHGICLGTNTARCASIICRESVRPWNPRVFGEDIPERNRPPGQHRLQQRLGLEGFSWAHAQHLDRRHS
ncbi:MAG: hypothetical protein R2748_25775 [Bryobacterales bacterium]